MFLLVKNPADGTVRSIALGQEQQELTIGRQPDCQIVLDSRQVSRKHACFFGGGGNWFVAENADELNDRQVLILIYPQIAGKGPEIKMPPSAETADTVDKVEVDNKTRVKEENSKKESFWQRWF